MPPAAGRTRRRRRSQQTEAPATPETPVVETPAEPEVPATAEAEAAPRQRNSLGHRVGGVGTVENHTQEAADLLAALQKARKNPASPFEIADSDQPELRLTGDGGTLCYLVQRKDSKVLTARYRQRKTESYPDGLNIKNIGDGTTPTQAAKIILAHWDEWKAIKGTRRAKPAEASAEDLEGALAASVEAAKGGSGS